MKLKHIARLSLMAAVALTLHAAYACDTCTSKMKPGIYLGEVKAVGNGVAYTWVTLNEKGKPAAIGVTMTETALQQLPETLPGDMKEIEFALELPKEAKKTAFDHVGLNWNPKGHDPSPIYTVPHLDFHFYTLPQKERERITAKGDDLAKCRKPLPSAFLAPGYIFAPGSEMPMMGAHWVDPTSPELNGKPFTQTMIYGSYDGKLAFIEPMVAKSYLETQPNTTEELKVPAYVQKTGYYPTRYSVRFDPSRREYVIALEGLIWREAKRDDLTVSAR